MSKRRSRKKNVNENSNEKLRHFAENVLNPPEGKIQTDDEDSIDLKLNTRDAMMELVNWALNDNNEDLKNQDE